MTYCVICHKPTKDQRKTCSKECLEARQLQLRVQLHDILVNKDKTHYESYLDKKLERREIEGVLNDL